jgi:hypothetical protein
VRIFAKNADRVYDDVDADKARPPDRRIVVTHVVDSHGAVSGCIGWISYTANNRVLRRFQRVGNMSADEAGRAKNENGRHYRADPPVRMAASTENFDIAEAFTWLNTRTSS